MGDGEEIVGEINEAIGERDRFLSMYNEYANFPQITRERMYLEMLEKILPNIKVYIDDGTGVQKLLPLESLFQSQSGTGN